MATVDDLDVTKPDGATEKVSVLDNEIKDLKTAVRTSWFEQHHRTGHHKIGKGNTASRPVVGKLGQIYFNDDTNTIEFDNGASWVDIGYYTNRIKAGTFTGDGAASQAITGVGFQATILFIFRLLGGAMHIKTTGLSGINTHKVDDGTITTDGVDSFDVDGFTVSLGLNASADVYIYIAMRDL